MSKRITEDIVRSHFKKDKERFDKVRRRAKEMGVIDMNLDGIKDKDILECYENALDILELNKDFILNNMN